jgi:hypothetical protein
LHQNQPAQVDIQVKDVPAPMNTPADNRLRSPVQSLIVILVFGLGWFTARWNVSSEKNVPAATRELWGAWIGKDAVLSFSNPIAAVAGQLVNPTPSDIGAHSVLVTPKQEPVFRAKFGLPIGSRIYLEPTIAQTMMGEAIAATQLAALFRTNRDSAPHHRKSVSQLGKSAQGKSRSFGRRRRKSLGGCDFGKLPISDGVPSRWNPAENHQQVARERRASQLCRYRDRRNERRVCSGFYDPERDDDPPIPYHLRLELSRVTTRSGVSDHGVRHPAIDKGTSEGSAQAFRNLALSSRYQSRSP